MRRIATFRCVDCGDTTTRRVQTGRPPVCLSCGLKRAVANAMEAADKKVRGDTAQFVEWGRRGGAPSHKTRRNT